MKTILLYLLLAGAPILGIFGVLLLGANLQAPAAVNGVWQFEVDNAVQDSCQPLAAWDGAPQMIIAQSGPRLTIQLNNRERALLSGLLAEEQITASGDPDYQLSATLDRRTQPHRLTAILNVPQCFRPITLTAIPQPAADSLPAGH
jgi:hypothetical protein